MYLWANAAAQTATQAIMTASFAVATPALDSSTALAIANLITSYDGTDINIALDITPTTTIDHALKLGFKFIF